MKINGGATLWARKTIDSDVFYKKPHVWFKIWFYLVQKANHQNNKQFKRGSCFMKYEWIMEKTRAKKSEVDHAIRWFKFGKMIATQKATRGFTITILKYDPYQKLESYKSDSKSDSKSDTEATQKRHRSDTINKNDNNDIYDKKKKEVEKIYFNYEEGEFNGITEEYILELQKDFPDIDIKGKIKEMRNWLLDHKENKYKRQGKRLFINNWLKRTQEKYNKANHDNLTDLDEWRRKIEKEGKTY